MKILIQTPSYVPASGGIRCLHYLGYLCHKLGHKVKMDCPFLNREWEWYSSEVDKPDFRIIPEIHQLTTPTIPVVRWVLYFPGVLCNGPKTYQDHEMIVAYHEDYLSASKKAAGHDNVYTFYLPSFDIPNVNEQIERNQRGAIWYGKGPRISLPETRGLPEITRVWPYPRLNLIRYLKSLHTLYSMDYYTAINLEAQLCGCEVKLWKENKFEIFLKENPDQYIMNIEYDLQKTKDFIETVKQHFGI